MASKAESLDRRIQTKRQRGRGRSRFVLGEQVNLDVTALVPSSYCMCGLNVVLVNRQYGEWPLAGARGVAPSRLTARHIGLFTPACLAAAGLCPIPNPRSLSMLDRSAKV